MAIIKNIYGQTIRQDDLPTVKETIKAWIAEFRVHLCKAANEVAELRAQVAALTEANSTALTIIGDAIKELELDGEHFATGRLRDREKELKAAIEAAERTANK